MFVITEIDAIEMAFPGDVSKLMPTWKRRTHDPHDY